MVVRLMCIFSVCILIIPLILQHEEAGGIPLSALRYNLLRHGATDELPQSKIDFFIVKADNNQDGRITYKEFLTAVSL